MLVVDCGKCMACRIKRTMDWTTRLSHELVGKTGCFLTLTYDEESNPVTLVKRDVQLFIKRLRKYCNLSIKYLFVGEYGEKRQRPHYHGIVCGWSPDLDKVSLRSGVNVYTELEDLWSYGMCYVGSADTASIRYTVGYIQKKLYGAEGKEAYEEQGLLPPFQLCSKGIGYEYAEQHKDNLLQGKKAIPRYYLKRFGDDFRAKVHARFEEKEQKEYDDFKSSLRSVEVPFDGLMPVCDEQSIVMSELDSLKISDRSRVAKDFEAKKRMQELRNRF